MNPKEKQKCINILFALHIYHLNLGIHKGSSGDQMVFFSTSSYGW